MTISSKPKPKSCGRLSGTITVFLTLCLMLIIALITAVIASARDRSMRMRCENAMDLGLLSVFGEYNRELLKEFDLYFIDSSYGCGSGSPWNTGERLKDYIRYNLNPSKGLYAPGSRDLFGLSVEDVQMGMESLATDSGGRVFKRQAIRYVKDKYGVSAIESIDKSRKDYIQYGIGDCDTVGEREETQSMVETEAEDVVDDEGEQVEYENPVEDIENTRSGVLDLLLGSTEISGRSIDTSELYSDRYNSSGCGIVANTEDLDSITSNLMFDFYIGDKFSSYTVDKGRKGLRYEMEYVIHGAKSDKENLEAVIASLMLMREAANFLYIFSDQKLKAKAESAASVVSLITFAPWLKDGFTLLIVLAWAFAESCIDMRTLLDGYKVPLMKSPSSWVLDGLTKALTYKSHLMEGRKKSSGLDWGGYLQILLGLTGSQDKLKRAMNVVEDDVRHTPGNDDFRLDNCIEFLEADVRIKSSFGREYEIKRYFGYLDVPARSFE